MSVKSELLLIAAVAVFFLVGPAGAMLYSMADNLAATREALAW